MQHIIIKTFLNDLLELISLNNYYIADTRDDFLKAPQDKLIIYNSSVFIDDTEFLNSPNISKLFFIRGNLQIDSIFNQTVSNNHDLQGRTFNFDNLIYVGGGVDIRGECNILFPNLQTVNFLNRISDFNITEHQGDLSAPKLRTITGTLYITRCVQDYKFPSLKDYCNGRMEEYYPGYKATIMRYEHKGYLEIPLVEDIRIYSTLSLGKTFYTKQLRETFYILILHFCLCKKD